MPLSSSTIPLRCYTPNPTNTVSPTVSPHSRLTKCPHTVSIKPRLVCRSCHVSSLPPRLVQTRRVTGQISRVFRRRHPREAPAGAQQVPKRFGRTCSVLIGSRIDTHTHTLIVKDCVCEGMCESGCCRVKKKITQITTS